MNGECTEKYRYQGDAPICRYPQKTEIQHDWRDLGRLTAGPFPNPHDEQNDRHRQPNHEVNGHDVGKVQL